MARNIVVVGGGFVGMMSSLWISRINPNYCVTLIDRKVGGNQAASYGCAGCFAPYASTPINNPAIFTSLPKLLGLWDQKIQPLSFNWPYLFQMNNWIIQFLLNCRESKVNIISTHLGTLTREAFTGYDPFFQQITNTNPKTEVGNLVSDAVGCLYLWESGQSLERAKIGDIPKIKNGTVIEYLSKEQLQRLVPGVDTSKYHSGQLYHPSRFTTDPGQLLVELKNILLANPNNKYIEGNVTSLDRSPTQMTINYEDSNQNTLHLSADEMVLSGGIYSKQQLSSLGDNSIPLDTERGYHIMLEYTESSPKQGRLSQIVGIPERGTYLTPMSNGIRVAGLVEIGGGIDAPANPKKHDYLLNTAHEFYPISKTMKCASKWLGFRPTLPDALPVIGRSSIDPRIIYAFGHQHIGMTLGGITGHLVAHMISDLPTIVDVTPFSPKRFAQ